MAGGVRGQNEWHLELQLQERSEAMGEKAKLWDMTIAWMRAGCSHCTVSAVQVLGIVRLCAKLESKGENAGGDYSSYQTALKFCCIGSFCASDDNVLRLNTVVMLKNAHFPQDFRLQNNNS